MGHALQQILVDNFEVLHTFWCNQLQHFIIFLNIKFYIEIFITNYGK